MPSRDTLDVLISGEFLVSLAFGMAALAIGFLAVYLRRWWADTPAPIVAVLITGVAIAGLQTTRGLPNDLLVGVVLLGIGGTLYPWVRKVPFLPVALAVPGAWWVTRVVDLPGATWVLWLLFAWIVIGAPLVTSFDRHFASQGYGPVLLVISIAGMFTTLPDTEEILVLLGAAAPLALLAWPKVVASLGAIGIYPALGMMAWAIAFGGRGRESAVIGATASLAILVVEPLIRWWRGKTLLDGIPDKWWWVPGVAGLQLLVVLLVARLGGLRNTSLRAAVVAGLVLSATAIVLMLAVPRSPTRSPNHRADTHKTPRRS